MVNVQIEELMQRVQLLEDERNILQTLHRYCHAIEIGLEEEWVGCFTEDGRLLIHWRDQTSAPIVGHKELAKFIANHSRAPSRYHKHIYAVPLMTIDGNSANVTGYVVRIDEDEGEPTIWSFGRYHDQMVKTSAGQWRIHERRLEIESAHHNNPFNRNVAIENPSG